jgi:hypothetical protein
MLFGFDARLSPDADTGEGASYNYQIILIAYRKKDKGLVALRPIAWVLGSATLSKALVAVNHIGSTHKRTAVPWGGRLP